MVQFRGAAGRKVTQVELGWHGRAIKEEDEERMIRDFTTAKERIWLYTPWLSVQIFGMDMVFCFDAREESLSRFRHNES